MGSREINLKINLTEFDLLYSGLTSDMFVNLHIQLANRLFLSRQMLRELNRSDIQKILTGKTINLVSNDAQKLEKVL